MLTWGSDVRIEYWCGFFAILSGFFQDFLKFFQDFLRFLQDFLRFFQDLLRLIQDSFRIWVSCCKWVGYKVRILSRFFQDLFGLFRYFLCRMWMDSKRFFCFMILLMRRWIAEAWSACSMSCGGGIKERHVVCVQDPNNTRVIILINHSSIS